MSWEALRLSSKSPSEVYAVLGPHGVEELLREARSVCWREHPAETRTVSAVKQHLTEVFGRNMKVWEAIKKPSPDAFFADLLPHAADGHIRQALVLTWMMMPRAGGRDFADSAKIVRFLFERMLANWDEDDVIFTKAFGAKTKPAKAAAGKPKGAKHKKPKVRR
ncbi:MAG: hypothetical protein ACHRHE_12475 [Tepidisphaerales bacterium]